MAAARAFARSRTCVPEKHGPSAVVRALVLLACVAAVAGRLGGDCYPRPSNRSSILLQTQTDMDNMYAGCTRIVGGLDVICSSTDVINNLEVLQTVTEITGYLHIEGCASLPNLVGLRNLQVVGGQQLYSTPTEGGFSVYIVNNPFSDLTGLEQLTTVSAGRVKISGPSTLCYLDQINWQSILGPNYYRLLSLSGGSYAYCQTRTCNAACSCGTCFGPSALNCQGTCSSSSSTDSTIIVALCVIGFGLVVIMFLMWMCLTNRCGCRCRCFRRSYQWGVLPSAPVSSWDSSKRRGSVTPLAGADPFALAMADYSTQQQQPQQGTWDRSMLQPDGSGSRIASPQRPSSDSNVSRPSVPRILPPVSIFPADQDERGGVAVNPLSSSHV